jgi:hypothetical protein
MKNTATKRKERAIKLQTINMFSVFKALCTAIHTQSAISVSTNSPPFRGPQDNHAPGLAGRNSKLSNNNIKSAPF